MCQPSTAVLPFLFPESGISQGTLFLLLHPLGLCNCIKNVPTQSSMTEVVLVLVSVMFTKTEPLQELAVYPNTVISLMKYKEEMYW